MSLTFITTPKNPLQIEHNADPDTDAAISDYLFEMLAQRIAASIRERYIPKSVL